MSEPDQVRRRRRAKTIPAMLAATLVAIVGFLLFAAIAIAVDLARLRLQFPTVRVYLFLLQYLINDSVEILAAPILWAVAGFGTKLTTPASIARHERLQWWSVRLLQARAETLLGLRMELDDEPGQPPSGPVIAMSRHISVFDASLPSLIFQSKHIHVRGVIMAEMLADPGFDLIYARLGSVFTPRDDGPKAITAVAGMTSFAPENTAYVIFPEGRLFRPVARDRLLSRLDRSDPERARRLAGLTHVLPPRPGGLQALLATLPEADVVMIHHEGLDRFTSLAALLSVVPVQQPVRVRLERFPRATIPEDPDQQARWLDRRWAELDAELAQQSS